MHDIEELKRSASAEIQRLTAALVIYERVQVKAKALKKRLKESPGFAVSTEALETVFSLQNERDSTDEKQVKAQNRLADRLETFGLKGEELKTAFLEILQLCRSAASKTVEEENGRQSDEGKNWTRSLGPRSERSRS